MISSGGKGRKCTDPCRWKQRADWKNLRGEGRMAKRLGGPGTWLYPLPPVLVSCAHGDRTYIITLAWAGVACSEPPIISLGIRAARYSYGIIKHSGEYLENIPRASQVEQVEFCCTVCGC